MTDKEVLFSEKLKEVVRELKHSGLWQQEQIPAWVHQFEQQGCESAGTGNTSEDKKFIEWLRFIYVPNCLAELEEKGHLHGKQFIAPQAARIFGKDKTKVTLLRLLIELDAIV